MGEPHLEHHAKHFDRRRARFAGEGAPYIGQSLGHVRVHLERRLAHQLRGPHSERVEAAALRQREHPLQVQGEQLERRAGDRRPEPFLARPQRALLCATLGDVARATTN
jgi:hypothetical protein